MEYCYANKQSHSQRIIPTGLPELTFFLGDKVSSIDPGRNYNSNAVLSGQQKGYYELSASGHLRLIAVTFLPHGLASLDRIIPPDLYNFSVDANLIWGNDINILCEELYNEKMIYNQINLIENFLVRRLSINKVNHNIQRIDHIIPQISPVRIQSINTLSQKACWSRKQFERSFSAMIGCSPRQFINTIRFQYAINLKALRPDSSLLDIALASGYYDQAHMANDFVKHSGLSPRDFFKTCPPTSDYFGL